MRNIYFPPTVNKYCMYLTLKDSHWVKTRSSFSLPCYLNENSQQVSCLKVSKLTAS